MIIISDIGFCIIDALVCFEQGHLVLLAQENDQLTDQP
jgi:hypothetical protein